MLELNDRKKSDEIIQRLKFDYHFQKLASDMIKI